MAVQQDLFAVAPAPKVVEPAEPIVPKKTLTLIDATGFVFRAYYALPSLTTSKGVVSHAVLGFTRMLLKLLRERAPTHVTLCFDKDSRKGRLAIDPTYKANREAPPDDLISQFAWIRKVAEVLRLPVLEFSGWEADDVIASITKRARTEGFDVEIVASDKDFLQLLEPGVRIFDPVKDRELDEAYALERYGVRPKNMCDYQALVGDAIDNIAKVPGIGPKTAVELISQFGSVDSLLSRLSEVTKPKTRASLEANAEQLKRALQLVTFKTDLQLDVSLESLARQDIDQPAARALFTELEFFRLLTEMPSGKPTPLRQTPEEIVDREGLERVVAQLKEASRVALAPAFDGEPHSASLQGLGVVPEKGGCFYVDVEACTAEAVRSVLGPALVREGLEVCAHDGKELLHVLWQLGLTDARVDVDIELLSYLLNPSRKEHALTDLARERLRAELPVLTLSSGETVAQTSRVIKAPVYGAAADAIHQLTPMLWQEADGVGMGAFARSLELPFVSVLTRMERRGVLIDRAALATISVQVDASVKEMLAEVYKHAGKEFNVGSPAQLANVLYDELKLPVLKKNKTGPSTDHEVLEKLAEQHPLPQAIIEYRNVAKLKSTYLDTLPQLISADGRVRTTFHQAAAATGRLSSTNPNLQNIPIRTELGRQIRTAFVAPEGSSLVSCDYSQIELRILAHISKDEALIEAFIENMDVHARTAAEVFGVPLAEVKPEQRRAAKMVNYGIAYGLSPHGLSTRLNIPVDEARGIIDRYFERFPGIHGYVDGTVEKARKTGYVESLLGRRRYMPDLVSRNRSIAMGAERAAINMPIQGTAADLIKKAMIELDATLSREPERGAMLLQVHDELLFEAKEAEAEKLGALAREVMTSVMKLDVPLVVDVGIGRSWSAAH